jgi:hypothetical protein
VNRDPTGRARYSPAHSPSHQSLCCPRSQSTTHGGVTNHIFESPGRRAHSPDPQAVFHISSTTCVLTIILIIRSEYEVMPQEWVIIIISSSSSSSLTASDSRCGAVQMQMQVQMQAQAQVQ